MARRRTSRLLRTVAAVHPAVREQVADWLEEASDDARDRALYPNPHLAAAFASLAEAVRRRAPVPPHRAAGSESRVQQ